jgi:hypothetical protein
MLIGYVVQAQAFMPLPLPLDIIKAAEAMATKDLNLSNILPAHEDIVDLDYVPNDHNSDVSLRADPIDPTKLINLLNSVNPYPGDKGVISDQDQDQDQGVVLDPVVSKTQGVNLIEHMNDDEEGKMGEDKEGENPDRGEDQTGDQVLEIDTGVIGNQDKYGKGIAHDIEDKEDNTRVHTVTKTG